MSDPADVTRYDPEVEDGPRCAICGQPISADEAFRWRHDADEVDHDAVSRGDA